MRANLDKAYARFTPDERLALLVESAARRDHAEADRLWQTAPIVSMQGVHPTVSLKWSELESFTSALVITLQGLIACFHAAYALNRQRDSYARGWLDAGGKAKALALQEKRQEPESEEIAEAVFARAREAATFASCFDAACEEIGFSRDTLVRAFVSPYHAEQLSIELPIVEHFTREGIDEQLKADMLEALRKRHPALFGNAA